MPRNLVLFDLEWNIGYQPYTFNYHGVQQTLRGEIMEIGAVKIDEDANVLDTFSIHLRPRIFRKLQHHIAKVTGLTQADLDKASPSCRDCAALCSGAARTPSLPSGVWTMCRCSSRTCSCAIWTSPSLPCGTTCSRSFFGSIPARKVRA